MDQSSQFKFLSILGRPGSGKGTQAELLEKQFPFKHVSTGHLLRDRAKQNDFVGEKIAEYLSKGKLAPTPIAFLLWMPEFELLQNQQDYRGILFDGSPRKLYEARMLDEVLELFGWERGFRALSITISEEESTRRLMARGRSDDNPEEIKSRLGWFREEVQPVIEYYRQKGILVEVDGERPAEEIHRDILACLKDFLTP